MISPGYSQAMTVLSRGARVRRGGRRLGWALLTVLLVLAIGASSALVFTNRVELLKFAVILALWAAIAGAFVSMFYRRQSDADRARARDMKLVYGLQLDREISARHEYELSVESQLRRELAVELGATAADEVAALRAELTTLRTSLEILFDADLGHRPALETVEQTVEKVEQEVGPRRAFGDWAQTGQSPPADWVSSDRVTTVKHGDVASRPHDAAIIDVPEVPNDERWLMPDTPGSHRVPADAGSTPAASLSGRRRRSRHSSPEDQVAVSLDEVRFGRHSGESSRLSAEPPRQAPPPPPEPAPRHRSVEAGPDIPQSWDKNWDGRSQNDGQSVADLMARLRVEPTGGGRRRRRDS